MRRTFRCAAIVWGGLLFASAGCNHGSGGNTSGTAGATGFGVGVGVVVAMGFGGAVTAWACLVGSVDCHQNTPPFVETCNRFRDA